MADTPVSATNTSSTLHAESTQDFDILVTEPQNAFSKQRIDVNTLVPTLTAKRSIIWRRAQSTPPEITARPVSRRHSKARDLRQRSEGDADISWGRLNWSKKKSQYFEREFSSRHTPGARDRIIKDSLITISIKLNCSLDEVEQSFHCDLSFTLSEIYQRPASCIVVMVSTDTSILLYGTFDPAYYITLTALPPDIAETKNKRSAFFIQQFMQEHLGIQSTRGVIQFETVPEENLVVNGQTASQEIQALGKHPPPEKGFSRPGFHQNLNKCGGVLRSSIKRSDRGSPNMIHSSGAEAMDALSRQAVLDGDKRVRKRKSLMSFFLA